MELISEMYIGMPNKQLKRGKLPWNTSGKLFIAYLHIDLFWKTMNTSSGDIILPVLCQSTADRKRSSVLAKESDVLFTYIYILILYEGNIKHTYSQVILSSILTHFSYHFYYQEFLF